MKYEYESYKEKPMKQENTDRIELKIPAKADYLTALRLFISGLAMLIGYDLDKIEDVKLSIGEAFLQLVNVTNPVDGPIRVSWSMGTDLIITLSDPTGKHKFTAKSPIIQLYKYKEPENIVIDHNKEKNAIIEFTYPLNIQKPN